MKGGRRKGRVKKGVMEERGIGERVREEKGKVNEGKLIRRQVGKLAHLQVKGMGRR